MDIFTEVKARVKILDVVGRFCRGSPVKRGRNYFINSPFSSKDKNASCEILPETNSFRCFSSGYKGDLIKLVAIINQISNIEAAKLIANEFGIVVEDGENNSTKAKAIADRQRQQLELETYAKYLIKELNSFYQKIADNFKYFDGMLKEIGHFEILKPDDDLLKELVLNRNKYQELCHEFINGNFEERYVIYAMEELKA